MRLWYLAHPLSSPTAEGFDLNRGRAVQWGAWLAETFDVAIAADWIWLSLAWEETDENRARGLDIDKATIERCDAIVLCGGRLSNGMRVELEHAVQCGKKVIDLLAMGCVPPAKPDALLKLSRLEVA